MTGGGPGRLFHGGFPHLLPGGLVLPPARTGQAGGHYPGRRRDRVYLSEDPQQAAMFAALWPGGGAVYEVEPVGPVERDPYSDADRLHALVWACAVGRPAAGAGGSWSAGAARVLRVVAVDVVMTADEQRECVAAGELVTELGELGRVDSARYWRVMERTDVLQADGLDLRAALVQALAEAPDVSAPGPRAGVDGDGWVVCERGCRHWGRFGAAGLLVVTGGASPRVLMQRRGAGCDGAGLWAVPGGALHGGESAREGGAWEMFEETGLDLRGLTVIAEHRVDHGGWSYTTVVVSTPEAVTAPALSAESAELRWVPVGQVDRLPLLPAFEQAWPELRVLLPVAAGVVVPEPAAEPLSLIHATAVGGELWQGGHECAGCPRCPPLRDDWSLVVDLCSCSGSGWVDTGRYLLLDIPDGPLTGEQQRDVEHVAGLVAQQVQAGGRVLVRCHWGLNRSGLVAGLALQQLGMDGPAAVELIRARRGRWALWNGGFALAVAAGA